MVPGGLGARSLPAQVIVTQALKRLVEKSFAMKREARNQAWIWGRSLPLLSLVSSLTTIGM